MLLARRLYIATDPGDQGCSLGLCKCSTPLQRALILARQTAQQGQVYVPYNCCKQSQTCQLHLCCLSRFRLTCTHTNKGRGHIKAVSRLLQQGCLVFYKLAAFANNPKTQATCSHLCFINENVSTWRNTYWSVTCGVPGDFIPALMHALHPYQLSNDLGCQHHLIDTKSVLTRSLISVAAHELLCFWARRLSLLCQWAPYLDVMLYA